MSMRGHEIMKNDALVGLCVDELHWFHEVGEMGGKPDV